MVQHQSAWSPSGWALDGHNPNGRHQFGVICTDANADYFRCHQDTSDSPVLQSDKNPDKGSTLTIMWSESKLLSPKPSDIPSGLHLWTAPITRTYAIRGKDLLVTTDSVTQIFYRVAEGKT